ncbi:MAG: hypothetical protein E7586_04650 [Ruminococcaceae bacterium]|nr:hypothetical protein [Oscillospiraceae bacterium]
MKRILLLVLALLTLLSVTSCAKDESTRTYHFYKEIKEDSFWYACTITKDGETYRYAQALDKDSVTTIEDHDDDADDGYAIYEPANNYVHELIFSAKKYNTTVAKEGVKFLFGNNEPIQFRAPDDAVEEAEFDGKTYYCEIFETVDENGDRVGENKYYFDGMKLIAIEWIEDGEVVTTLRMTEYSETIPESVYTSLPEDFKAGTFIAEDIIPPRPVVTK